MIELWYNAHKRQVWKTLASFKKTNTGNCTNGSEGKDTLPENLGSMPAPTLWLTAICNSRSSYGLCR